MLKYIDIMENQPTHHEKERNPITHQAHRREVFWQITLPFIVGAVLFLALAFAASWGAMGGVRAWADIGVIWLILMMFLPGLVIFVLLAGLAYGITWLFRRLPEYALQTQNLFLMIAWQVKQGADKTVEPLLRIEGARAGLKSIFRK